jgi:hypothetical protein
MSIIKFRFADNGHGWSLNETSFTDFNLLVGKSGVGKTHVLDALRTIRSAGTSKGSRRPNGCEWAIEIMANGITYIWEAETSLVESASIPNSLFSEEFDDEDDSTSRKPVFISERLWTSDANKLIIERTPDSFRFNDVTLPKLNDVTSAISLLQNEDSIAPIYTALRRILFSVAPSMPHDRVVTAFDAKQMESLKKRCQNLDALREATDISVLRRGLLLQEEYKDEFAQLKEDYISIFPSVIDIRIGTQQEFEPDSLNPFPFPILTIAIKEEGIGCWIVGTSLSSGMYRTLLHLLELALAPKGTVLCIDELENSLGVNCLDEVVHTLLRRSKDIQFIATSHHPYVINAVPPSQWRLVTRKGSVITVKDETSIPALKSRSSQDNFIRLINLVEYEEGVN